MRRLAELLVFVALALAAHLALLAYEPPRGSDAGGAGGEAMVTLAAAPAQIDEVLRAWMQAPEAETAAQDLEIAEQAPQAQPDLPDLAIDAAPRTPLRIAAMTAPDLPSAPKLDTKPPAPRPDPTPEPEKEVEPEEAAKPAPAPPSEAAVQKASGAGRTGQAGQRGPAVIKTTSGGQRARMVAVWGAKLRAGIERKKRYPRGARGSGAVRVRIQVARSGQLLSSRIMSSSGGAAFDAAALAAVTRAAPFLPAPEGLTDQSYSFVLTMQFDR